MTTALHDSIAVSLPTRIPTLVMVGASDPGVLSSLDLLLGRLGNRLDLRTNTLWTEVPDGLGFLISALEQVPTGRGQVRIGFASPDSSMEELLGQALLSHTMLDLGLEFERVHTVPPTLTYQVRYQPIVSLQDRSIIGFESLLRASSDDGPMTADQLIERATTLGKLAELDALGRELAIDGVGPWLGQGLLFLNMMAPDGDFDDDAVSDTIDAAIHKGLASDQLVLEAVERNRYSSLDSASQQLNVFRDRGVRIAVDDVGDGYSSLRTVARFKPDIVKIAGSLASEMVEPEGRAVVRAIVQLAHESGAWVVAENIESAEQAQQALNLGVDWGQGHYFGVPGLP